jgi:hypothetical protein
MKLHVLDGNYTGNFQIVVHGATPAGNNSAGFSWQSVILASNKNTSVLTVGSAPGQTTQAEMDAILAGTVLEGVFEFTDNAAWTNQQRIDELNLQATQCFNNVLNRYAQQLKWYGSTIA